MGAGAMPLTATHRVSSSLEQGLKWLIHRWILAALLDHLRSVLKIPIPSLTKEFMI